MKIVIAVAAAVIVATAGILLVRGPDRPPLDLPAASAFRNGPCRDVADPVLALGRLTYEHADAKRLPADAYPLLRQRADQLMEARDGAGQALSGRIDAVLTAIGFLRLRPGAAYDPRLLTDLETARAALQHSCVGAS